MWEKLTSLSTGDLTVIGVCILAVNLLLVILITIAVNKRAKKQSAVTEPIRKKVANSGVYVSPTPLRASASITAPPTPPTPNTITFEFFSVFNFSSPIKLFSLSCLCSIIFSFL